MNNSTPCNIATKKGKKSANCLVSKFEKVLLKYIIQFIFRHSSFNHGYVCKSVNVPMCELTEKIFGETDHND